MTQVMKCNGSSCTGKTIDKTGSMQAGFPQSHRMIQSMNRKRRVHIMDLVSGFPHFLNCREQYFFIIKTTYYKFFYCHRYRILRIMNYSGLMLCYFYSACHDDHHDACHA